MIKKYGQAHVDNLLLMKNQGQRWTDWELDMLIKEYKEKVKNLTKERQSANMV